MTACSTFLRCDGRGSFPGDGTYRRLLIHMIEGRYYGGSQRLCELVDVRVRRLQGLSAPIRRTHECGGTRWVQNVGKATMPGARGNVREHAQCCVVTVSMVVCRGSACQECERGSGMHRLRTRLLVKASSTTHWRSGSTFRTRCGATAWCRVLSRRCARACHAIIWHYR